MVEEAFGTGFIETQGTFVVRMLMEGLFLCGETVRGILNETSLK